MIKGRKVIIAFLAGVSGMFFLIGFSWLFKSPSPNFDNPFLLLLFFIIFAGVMEEGINFLLISRWGKFPYYCIFLGLGFGLSEIFFRDVIASVKLVGATGFSMILDAIFWEKRLFGIIMHILMAVMLAYFIKKEKPAFGLIFAIIIHGGINTLLSM